MGALDKDTAVEARDGDSADDTDSDETGRWTARLSDDWNIWGPNGGYVATVALRAAGVACGRQRPASILVHYQGVAAFDEVDLTTTVLRRSRYATSVRVSMTQADRPILEALVWGLDEIDNHTELAHEMPTAPDVAGPDELKSLEERLAEAGEEVLFKFWENLEQRALDWLDDWPPPGPLDPIARWWLRFRPTATFDDPWLDAGRALIPVDTMGWPAGNSPHAYRNDPMTIIAPTVDLSVRFHRMPSHEEWLLCEAVAPVASAGLVAATGRVWNRQGQLLASGGQTMLCRPAPTPPA